MTSTTDLEHLLRATLAEDVPARPPENLLEAVVAATATVRQRPRLLALAQAPTMRRAGVTVGSRAVRWSVVLLALALTIALVGTVALLGARLTSPPVLPHRVANGVIAFDTNGDIAVVDWDGTGRPRVIAARQPGSSYVKPSWSADGERLAFLRLDGSGVGRALVISAADGSNPREIDADAPVAFAAVTPRWDATGTRIALIGERAASAQPGVLRVVLVVDIASGSIAQIPIAATEDASVAEIAWSPDGSWLAVAAENGTRYDPFIPSFGPASLWLVRPDGSDRRHLVSAAGAESYRSLTWSLDGRLLTYARLRTGLVQGLLSSIHAIDIDQVTDAILVSGHDFVWANFSPDGRLIALLEQTTPVDGIPWIAAVDGTGLRRLAIPGDVNLPAVGWSPDSGYVFARVGGSVQVMPIEGTPRGTYRIGTGPSVGEPSWQPLP